MSAELRLEHDPLRRGALTDEEWPALTAAAKRLCVLPFELDDSQGLTPIGLKIRAREVRRKYGDLGLIVLDYLQLMRVPGVRQGERIQEVSEVSRSLKELAKEMHCPVLALAQLSRRLEDRVNKRPILSDLRDSGQIEQDADVVLFVRRDEVHNPDSSNKGVAEIIIGKQRNGPIGTVRLAARLELCRFENLAQDYRPPASESKPPGKVKARGSWGAEAAAND